MTEVIPPVKSTDFRSARRRNMRRTIILCFALLAVLTGFGYLVGWGFDVLIESGRNPEITANDAIVSLWTSVSYGGIRAAVITFVLGAIWTVISLLIADRAVIWMAGGIEATGDTADEVELRNLIEEMAIAAGLPAPKAYIIEDQGLNAFATGLMPDRAAIAVTRGLMNKLNREELQAVIGHEMGHIMNGDVRLMISAAAIIGLIVFFGELMYHTRYISSGLSRSKNKNAGAIMLVVVLVWIVGGIIAWTASQIIRLAISRQREYLADATSVMLTRNPAALASALSKIAGNPVVVSAGKATSHLYIFDPLPALFSTHPPIERRIERITNLR